MGEVSWEGVQGCVMERQEPTGSDSHLMPSALVLPRPQGPREIPKALGGAEAAPGLQKQSLPPARGFGVRPPSDHPFLSRKSPAFPAVPTADPPPQGEAEDSDRDISSDSSMR